mmetsp:Transcript_62980/g.150695  ORF Transcript_62980/g.150695 Transcript_62980/m.150695 type:complete len:780 (+) Transcript_62980:178-2517(+)
MTDLTPPLLDPEDAAAERCRTYHGTLQPLMYPQPCRVAKALVAFCTVDLIAACVLSSATYNWDAGKLWDDASGQCSPFTSVSDLIAAALVRLLLVSPLVFKASWARNGATSGTYLACLSGGWAAVKAVASCTDAFAKDPCVEDRTQWLAQVLCVESVLSGASVAAALLLLRLAAWPAALRRALLSPEDAATAAAAGPSNLASLVALARPEATWLAAGCLVLLVRLPFSLAIPHYVSETIGALNDKEEKTVWFSIGAIFFCGTMDAMLDFWNIFFFGFAKSRIIKAVRLKLFANILRQEVAFFDTIPSGDLSSRLNSDTAEMSNDLTWVLRFTIEATVRMTGIIGYMLYKSPKLAGVAFALTPIVAVISRVYGRWMAKNAKAVQDALASASSVAQEVVGAMRTVFSFANEELEHARFAKGVERHYRLSVRQTVIQGVYYMSVNTFLMNCVMQCAILSYGARLVLDGEIPTQTLLAFMLYLSGLQEWTGHLFDGFSNLIKSAGAGAKVFELMRREPLVERSGNAVVPSLQGRVTLEGVSFKYPTRSTLALNSISLSVDPGQVLALVGSSGGGKSTIFHLLQHFFEPDQGRVLLDGHEVMSLNHKWLHRVVALVGQEPVLFSGSIQDNVTYGLRNDGIVLGPALDARVLAAAKIANASTFVSQLPDGFKTSTGERGVQLSGGQKQRIAIARAVIQDPKVLLLDEATSALDNESERLVRDALDRVMKGRSVLLIAHRASTIAAAPRVAVLDAGVVVEQGSQAELAAREGGAFHTLMRARATPA